MDCVDEGINYEVHDDMFDARNVEREGEGIQSDDFIMVLC